MVSAGGVCYWDTSAVISALLHDEHSRAAIARLERSSDVHLLSSLTHAEVEAVLARARRMGDERAEAARAAFDMALWQRTLAQPDPARLQPLAQRWPLRGADLWHLALATSLKQQLPGLELLTFDRALAEAAAGEGLGAAPL